MARHARRERGPTRRACSHKAGDSRSPFTLLLGIAFAGAAGAPQAQQPEEVVVTGSRIQRTGMTTPTPVTAVTAEELANIAPGTIMDALNQLPQFLQNDTAESVGGWTGSAGQSLLNLRGVGSVRTLVLLDGRRVVPSTRRGTTDVSVLPQALLSRTDVVTGGASAAYGSDAVSGVVNFILDTNYEGLEGSVQGGTSSRGDNRNRQASISGGTSIGERGHLIASAEYYHVDEVRGGRGDHGSGRRSWIEESWGTVTIAGLRHIVPDVRSTIATFGGIIKGGPLNNTQFDASGQPTPFLPGTLVSSTNQQGGSGDVNHTSLVPAQTRNTAFIHYKHDLSDTTHWYVQGLYGNAEVEYDKEAHNFNTGFPGTIQIYRDNAFLPQSIRDEMVARNLQSFTFAKSVSRSDGRRARTITDNTTASLTTGVRGEFGGERRWEYDVYYQFGQNEQDMTHRDNMRTDRFFRAIDSVIGPNGQITCLSTLSFPDDGCVPFNPFGVGTASEEAWNWVVDTQHQVQRLKQDVFEGSVSTDIGANWAGTISFASGFSYRKDDLSQYAVRPSLPYVDYPNPIPSTVGYRDGSLPSSYFGSTSVFAYGGIPQIEGTFDVREVFGETLIPLAEPLDFSAAVRYADYSGSGGVLAWKAGLDYQVSDQVRLRFTRSRDVRAATLNERFATTGRGGSVIDRFRNDEQYTIVSTEGANSSVDPENADTMTFGVVYQSRAIEGLNLSVDYYDIKISGAIDLLGNQTIMDQCYNGATQLCSLITRFDPAPGSSDLPLIRSIYNAYLNIAQARTSGLDIEATYRLPMGLHLRALLSHIAEASITNPGAPKLDRAGQNSLAPDWNALVSVGYDRGPFGFVWTQRYINEGVRNVEWTEGIDVDDNTVPSRSYTNLRAYWRRNAYEVYGNVQNMFDEEPPPVVGGSLYSDLGRTYTVGLRFDF